MIWNVLKVPYAQQKPKSYENILKQVPNAISTDRSTNPPLMCFGYYHSTADTPVAAMPRNIPLEVPQVAPDEPMQAVPLSGRVARI